MEDRVETENEALKLKQEISQVGSVNMESLQELDELQKRYESLANHFQDLTEARDNLHKIIAKINQDSRRLFLETLEAIRTTFNCSIANRLEVGTPIFCWKRERTFWSVASRSLPRHLEKRPSPIPC